MFVWLIFASNGWCAGIQIFSQTPSIQTLTKRYDYLALLSNEQMKPSPTFVLLIRVVRDRADLKWRIAQGTRYTHNTMICLHMRMYQASTHSRCQNNEWRWIKTLFIKTETFFVWASLNTTFPVRIIHSLYFCKTHYKYYVIGMCIWSCAPDKAVHRLLLHHAWSYGMMRYQSRTTQWWFSSHTCSSPMIKRDPM